MSTFPETHFLPFPGRCGDGYYGCQKPATHHLYSRWVGATQRCDCEVHRLNAVGNDHFDEGHAYPCENKLKLESLTLVRPDGDRLLLYVLGAR